MLLEVLYAYFRVLISIYALTSFFRMLVRTQNNYIMQTNIYWYYNYKYAYHTESSWINMKHTCCINTYMSYDCIYMKYIWTFMYYIFIFTSCCLYALTSIAATLFCVLCMRTNNASYVHYLYVIHLSAFIYT